MDSAKKIISEIKFRFKVFYQSFSLKIIFTNFFKYLFSRRFIFSHAFMMFLIFVLSLTSIYLFFSKFRTVEAFDSWFNENWIKRQKVVITYSSTGTITNYIGQASLPTKTLIAEGLMKNDCTDIRVVDYTLSTLNYWVDPQGCNQDITKIFFKVGTLYGTDGFNAGINTFYLYYGNSSASISTVAQTTLFVATIPNLRANYSFDGFRDNILPDNSDLGNNGRFIISPSTNPSGDVLYASSSFPEGYSNNAFYFNGYNVAVSTPVRMVDLTKAYTLVSFIKPEGTRANAYPTKYLTLTGNNYLLKKFNFENISKGATCAKGEFQDGDGVGACFTDGYTYTPDASTQKKLGSYGYFLDNFGAYLGTNASLSVTFNGTTQYLYSNTPVNFTPWFPVFWEYGYYYKVRLNGSPGEVRTIHSFGNTTPGNISYSFDYGVCSDGSLQFILDYRNSENPSTTLATPCLNNISPSTKISSSGGNYPIYANSSRWIDLATAHFQNKRYIFVNGVQVASDSTIPPKTLDREFSPSFIGKASNNTKQNLKGEIDDFFAFGNDSNYFNTIYFTNTNASGEMNTTVEQIVNNINKKSYLIFGGGSGENWTKAGFSNQAFGLYPSADAISDFNYNFNTTNKNDTFEQYSVLDNEVVNITASKLPTTLNLFSGKWYMYYTDFDDTRNSLISNYQLGATSTSFTRTYNNTNPNGVLYVGGYFNSNDISGTSSRPTEFFFGGMDDVYIYSSTLSATQLTYHSSPWNGYGSYGKTVWQAALPVSSIGKISYSQDFTEEEAQNVYWYNKDYPFRVQVNVSSLPNITLPNFLVSFTFDTSTPINNKRMNSDCSGILVNDSFFRNLPYWIEGCNKTVTKFYVRMNPDNSMNTNATYSIKGGANQILYIYYGNKKSTVSTYPPVQVFDYTIPSLEIAYTFEDDSTTVSFDKSGNAKNLTKSNLGTTPTGAFGNAPLFNGSTGYGSVPNPDATIRSSWEGITHLFWMKSEGLNVSVNRNPIVQQYPQTDNRYLNYAAIGGGGFTMRTQLYGPTDLLSITGTDVNNFNLFGVAWKFGSGNTVKSFYNNTFTSIANGSSYLAFPDTGDGLFIGTFCCNPGISNYWTGAIDEVRIFKRQLSDTEIGYYTYNTTIGTSRIDSSVNTCNQVNNFCMRSFVTPSYPTFDLLGKYNSNVTYSTFPEERLDSPYIYFKFNEGKSIFVNDSANRIGISYLGNIRTLNLPTGNEPSWIPENRCIEGECLYFDGLNDYVELATIPGSNADSYINYGSDYSYSFWVKPLSNPNSKNTIISFGQPSNAQEGYVVYYDGSRRLYTYGTGASGTYSNSTISTLPINKWSHVTFTYNNTSKTNKFYINGILDSTSTNPAACTLNACSGTSMNQIHLGGNAAGSNNVSDFMRGYLDEFKIFKTEISYDSVLDDYRKGLNTLKYNLSADADTVTNFNLVAYYPFDEADRRVAFDYSDIKAEATYLNTSNLNTAGIFNNAFSNPGNDVSKIFSIGNSSFINLTSQVTYSMWAKIGANSSGYLLYKGGTGGFNIYYDAATSKYTANICGVDLSTGNTYTADVWDNVVLTSNSKKAKLFINSVLQDEEYCFNSYVGSASNTNSIYLGGDFVSNGNSIKGLFDEFRIYDNYLTNQQVKLLYDYKPTYSAYGSNVTAFYKLDASAGTTTAVDASGNNNTLTMFASASNQNSWTTFGKIGNSYNFSTRAASTKNLFSSATSTVTTGLTRPYTLMGWVAFSEPFYGNYTSGQPPIAMQIGSDGSTANIYGALNINPNSPRVLDLRIYSNNLDSDRIFFSSPYLYLTLGAKNPIWYHVAGTYDGYLRKLYVNGELVNVDTGVSRTISIGQSTIVLGGAYGNYSDIQFQYNGLIDEAKIYNYARTQEQILMDMRNAGTSAALNPTFYSNIRSIQKQSALTTVSDSSIYPMIDINFDGYFGSNAILQSHSPVQLENITFNSVPANVSNYQLRFSIPFSTYNAARFSHPDCDNLLITDEKGRRLSYWGEPNSCKNGTGVVVVKIPYTGQTNQIKVMLDPLSNASGYLRNYSNDASEIFDTTLPELFIAYTFDDDTSSTSFDKSGNGNHLTKSNVSTTPTGAFGSSVLFNGSSSYGSVPNPDATIRSNWSGITHLFWQKIQGQNVALNRIPLGQEYLPAADQRYINVAALAGTGGYTMSTMLYANANLLSFTGTNVNNFNFYGTSWRFGSGNFVKSFYNSSISSLANGVSYVSFPNTGDGLFIGGWCCNPGLISTNYFSGALDEVRIFKRQLSDTEIRSYLGNGTSIAASIIDSTNTCNIPESWCTRSFVTPSYPSVDILGKFNSRVFPTYVTRNHPVFSVANSNALYAQKEGVRGDAALFSTLNSQISITGSQFNFLSGSDAAISFYIKPNNTNVGTLATSNGLQIKKLTDNLINFSGAGFNLTSTRTLPTNSWTHVFFQKNGQTGVYELSLDNVLQASSYSATNNMDLSNFKFIMDGTHTFYLDEFKIFDTVLTQNAISNLQSGGFGISFGLEDSTSCVNGSSSSCSTPTDEFLFDESSGQTARNSIRGRSDATLGITTSRSVGYISRGLSFPYTNTSTFSTNLINNSGEGSFSFWYKAPFNGVDGNFLMSGKGISIINYNDNFQISGNSFFNVYNELGLYGPTDPWHHLSINYNTSVTPAQLTGYLDGVKLIFGTFTKDSSDEKWMFTKGNLDNLRFYNYQRNQSQVSQEYARGKPYVYLKFDECNGLKFYNSNSNLYKPLLYRETGTRTDAPAFLNTGLNLTKASGDLIFNKCMGGKFNNSFNFDGSWYMEGNDYHSRTFNSEGNATISFWINLKGNINQNVTLLGSADGTNSHLIKVENKDINIYTNISGTTTLKLSGITDLASNDWTHVAITFENGSDYKIYINGNLDASATGTFTSILNTCTGGNPVSCTNRPFVLGKGFIGNIDELKIYNYPLTQKQIKIDMNQGSAIRIE